MEIGDGTEATEGQQGAGACPSAGVSDPPGAWGNLNGKAGSEAPGGVAQDVLRVGGEVAESHGPGVGESSFRKTASACGPGEGAPSERIQELEKKLDLAEKTIEVKELLGPMRSFGTLKKTDRSTRSDKKDCGDC